ncbi:PAS domain-containing sensor histidine kinase [Bacillus alveayuensis]|uniref:PAS domain-containing sensor histidine kinase n=1 Tax=Aeribacillus alveayuensis TaxID=279215 RepID=UPI0005D125B7|nr:PAS domain-containing sensor histidine kinase [Bacillus alveayuensis]
MKLFKSRIFWKIYIINLAIICMLLGLMFIVSRIILPEISKEQYRQITDKTVLRMKDQISFIVKDLQSLEDYVQSNEHFQSNDFEQLFKGLENIVTISPYIDSATVLDTNGYVQGFYPNDLKHLQNYNLSKREYFQQPLKTKKVYLSDVVSADTGRYLLVVSIPVLNNDKEVERVVNLSLRIENNQIFQSIFQSFKIGENGYTFIVDRNGKIISHPEKERIGEDVSQNLVVKKLSKKQSGYEEITNTKGITMLASFEHIPILDWGIVAQIPVDEIYQPYLAFQKSLWTISLITFIVLSILTALYARQMIHPIRRLYLAVDQVAKGDYNQRIEKIDNTEIGKLSSRFNEMIHYIRQSKANLQLKEEQLKEQKEFLRKIIDMNPSYIYAIDKEGKFTLVNESFAKLLGTETQYLLGKKIDDFQFNVKSNLIHVWEEIEKIKERPVLEEFKDKEGKIRWVETVRLPIFAPNAGTEQVLFVSTDITERKQAEELLRKSEKLAVVGELAAGVAHEIRNPLTSIKGFIHLLKEGNEKHKHYFDIIESELERISLIVNEFLMLGKPQVMNFQQKDVSVLLKDVMALFDAQAILNNVHIVSEFESDLPLLYCDENQLKQVFINVIKNAIEAMPNGGEMKIQAKVQENNLVIRFIDQGCGIPKDRIAKLGEPFYSTKEKGTGLGLMVSYKIIEAHRGSIKIESEVGRGTIVDIIFPIS